MSSEYRSGSLSLTGTVAMGTGVMIGAGIFALTGQIAELAGPWFPAAFVIAGFLVNIAGNEAIGTISKVAAVLKVGGILVFAGATIWAAGFSFQSAGSGAVDSGVGGMLAAVALGILAYKGFTTITTSGDEVEDPDRNVGRAIVISLAICVAVYLLVSWAVGSTLSITEIVEARDYSLAEAARPAFGEAGVVFTVVIAIIATGSGLLASLFAVSRMLAMLTDMALIPHRHFGMPGEIQQHTLVYTVVVAGSLAVLFDLSRIAAIGAIFYLVMDIAIQWGVFRHLRGEIHVRAWVPLAAIVADAVALVAFTIVKAEQDWLVVVVAVGGVVATFVYEALYLRVRGPVADDRADDQADDRADDRADDQS